MMSALFQRVDTWNYNVAINNYSRSDFDSSDWKSSKSGANVDLVFSADLTPKWTVGLTAQNLVPNSVYTLEVNGLRDSFKIRPQTTAGTAWSNDIVIALCRRKKESGLTIEPQNAARTCSPQLIST